MEKHFYIGEGPEAEALIAEVVDCRVSAGVARKAVQDEYSADGLLSRNNGGEICGLVFKEKQNSPFLKGEMRVDGGYGYYAKKNCKQGKELSAKLRAPDLQFSPSDHIVKKLNINRMCFGASGPGMAIYSTAAGFVDGKIIVSIPAAEKGDPMPSVPAWFREVKESEFIAAQGR